MIWYILVAILLNADGERVGMERISAHASKESCERQIWFVENSAETLKSRDRVKGFCFMADAPH